MGFIYLLSTGCFVGLYQLDNIDMMMEQFKGREEELLQTLQTMHAKKKGSQEDDDGDESELDESNAGVRTELKKLDVMHDFLSQVNYRDIPIFCRRKNLSLSQALILKPMMVTEVDHLEMLVFEVRIDLKFLISHMCTATVY